MTARRRERNARATVGVEPVPSRCRPPVRAVPRSARCGAAAGRRLGGPRGVSLAGAILGLAAGRGRSVVRAPGEDLLGGTTLPAPPAVPEAFSLDNVILSSNRWCSKYPPGFPLLLAVGWLLGAPWLVNPVLFGFAVYGLSGSARGFRATDGPSRRWPLRKPPVRLPPGGQLHVAHRQLRLAVWCLSLVADGDTAGSRVRLVAAGFLGGIAFLVRPASAVFLLSVPVLLLLTQAYPRGTTLPGCTDSSWRGASSRSSSSSGSNGGPSAVRSSRDTRSSIGGGIPRQPPRIQAACGYLPRQRLLVRGAPLERALEDAWIALPLAAPGPREASEAGSCRRFRRRGPLVGLFLSTTITT